MINEDLIYKLWYHQLKINNKIKNKLLNIYENEKEIYNDYEFIVDKYSKNNPINIKEEKKRQLNKAEEIYKFSLKNKINFLTVRDKEYPDILKTLEDAPYGLFYRGDIGLLKSRIVAIVGSRSCSNYGIEVTKLLTKEIIQYNISIISGGARGIDTVAHKNTIFNEGNTIVVLGSGIDIIYPKENYNLFKEIESKGLIITEFLPTTAPYKYNFPLRNRLISALSELVIVVEASEKSGSLITANYAAEQNKEVLAVPGMVFCNGSKGCNKLIREGAHIFTGLEDLYYLLKLDNEKKLSNNKPIIDKILNVIENKPTHIDVIIKKSLVDREAIYKILFEMQIRKEIIGLPGDFYSKII